MIALLLTLACCGPAGEPLPIVIAADAPPPVRAAALLLERELHAVLE